MRIFEYLFMQRAFVVGILLAAVVPCVGMVVVCKRLSMIGDALSHTSLAGVAAGLLLGVNPVAGAAAACVAASFGIEAIRRKLPRYSEMSISIIMSAGIGLAGVLSGFVKNSANFNSFLFGSIVAISDAEMISVIVVSVVVLALFLLLYKELFYISLDERSARLAGVPVGVVNFIFTIMIAVTVSVAARTVGALMVSSMMVVPVACAMQLGLSGKLLAVIGKLCVDRIDVRDRVASFCSGCIDNVDEHLGTLDMAQKFMAETDAFGSALDQSRNVCDDEALHIRQIDNSEVRI